MPDGGEGGRNNALTASGGGAAVPTTDSSSTVTTPGRIRVVVAKPGLDGHDRGAKVVAAALRDAGMEVIYTGLHQTPEMIVSAAVQEDVDVVAMSILSGAHMTLFPRVKELLDAEGADHVLITGGVHGDEFEPMAACRRLIAHPAQQQRPAAVGDVVQAHGSRALNRVDGLQKDDLRLVARRRRQALGGRLGEHRLRWFRGAAGQGDQCK